MKKWKSLFACGLVLLLTGWTMLCIPFNAYAQTWETIFYKGIMPSETGFRFSSGL